ncbi:Nramp family divalent metal transporter [Paraglaciecola sp. 2405UD69-4]|uniref:Nramp family divalent metal transporter n=1 Tax=Paraglaciecola sp. 2405UD69-4 TaxID=3391836 RepID=UPI0039C96702
MITKLRNLGPGVLVTAAFIGPGTITACTLAGANFGYALLWALLFATLSTIILQEMAVRLGIVAQQGLGEVLVNMFSASVFKWPLVLLIIIALYGGNSAYEAGNLAGAAIGIQAIVGETTGSYTASIIILSIVGACILLLGSYKQIEKVLIGLVSLMGLSFVLTFFFVQPSILDIFKGLVFPEIPEGGLLTVIALIGTTVVPYNLFLHAAAARNHWHSSEQLSNAKSDTIVSIGLGGLIAILVVSTSAASMFAHGLSVNSAADMAHQFEPLFGSWSKYLLGVGLFAAGLSSVITAPLATGYAICEVLKLSSENKGAAFRGISLSVIAIGSLLALTGVKPVTVILLAQFANGLLLPIVACFLLYAMNNKQLLGKYANSLKANILGGIVVLITAGLGAKMVFSALGI